MEEYFIDNKERRGTKQIFIAFSKVFHKVFTKRNLIDEIKNLSTANLKKRYLRWFIIFYV